ncbi:MAG: hypothetical protein N5P05_000954 [Chroococcopsis gigantea SAG 12.99]|jgi:filamentous hemagglutinin family protein|nr:filamentous hemagglutinin N-terminal domain-containing protein [Chlorogloea purpurea SAG 13.99]MDV2999348.1 hypothetical protein [Chroococcopsis gigantea SAG 12.99]
MASLMIGVTNCWCENKALAQITPDTTLGAEGSRVMSQEGQDSIGGGAIRGENLFHSFEKFNVDEGRSVYFNNPDGVARIFTRVTGNSVSKILGTLGVSGNADLFLMNPNGIIFGPAGSLDVKGSFVATTATSVKFAGDGGEFSAIDSSNPPLLTSNIPVGLQFRSAVGDIVLEYGGQNFLFGQPGKTLAFLGGNVTIEKSIESYGGRVELGSVAANSYVSLQPVTDGWTLGYEGVKNFQDIEIRKSIAIIIANLDQLNIPSLDVNPGNMQIQSRNLTIKDGSQILGSQGNIKVSATDTVEITGVTPGFEEFTSSINNQALSDEDAGKITIDTRKLILRDGGQVITTTTSINFFGQITIATGRGGDIIVKASDSVEIEGASREKTGLFAASDSYGVGGNIIINTPRLTINGKGTINVSGMLVPEEPSINPQAGNININSDSISLDRGSISAETRKGGGGSGANITIKAKTLLQLANESSISATAFDDANGGNITIQSPAVIAFSPTETQGSDIIARAQRGNGGNIVIDAAGIFGIAERLAVPGDQSNDIDASSQFGMSGQVELNNNLDPNQGVIQLPENVVDPDTLITQNVCRRGSQSQLTRSGRGGLPASPTDALSGVVTGIGLVEPASIPAGEAGYKKVSVPVDPADESIVPAAGWVLGADGKVLLTAYNPDTDKIPRLKDNINACSSR